MYVSLARPLTYEIESILSAIKLVWGFAIDIVAYGAPPTSDSFSVTLYLPLVLDCWRDSSCFNLNLRPLSRCSKKVSLHILISPSVVTCSCLLLNDRWPRYGTRGFSITIGLRKALPMGLGVDISQRSCSSSFSRRP